MINGDLTFLFLEVKEEEERGNKYRCLALGSIEFLQKGSHLRPLSILSCSAPGVQ